MRGGAHHPTRSMNHRRPPVQTPRMPAGNHAGKVRSPAGPATVDNRLGCVENLWTDQGNQPKSGDLMSTLIR